MNLKDYIGKRGESIFTVLMTRWCGGRQLFNDIFLGEKHESTDFMVELIEPTSGYAVFYVQVKSTRARYVGKGKDRKIAVEVTKEDVEKLIMIHVPTYVVGIDIDNERGFIKAITPAMSGGISGISTRNSLDRRKLRALWKEVDDYWKTRNPIAQSKFS